MRRVRKKFGGTLARYGAAYGAGRLARTFAYGSNWKKRKLNSGMRGGLGMRQYASGTTTQHDRTKQYTRKSRRPNKRWKKFVKRVRAVTMSDLGSQTRLFNDSLSAQNVTNLLTGIFECHLYPTGTVFTDIRTMGNELNIGNPTAAGGITTSPTTKIHFKTGIIDITVRNTSFFTTTGDIDSAFALECDLYEITYPRKLAIDTATAENRLTGYIGVTMAEQKRIGGAGLAVWDTTVNQPVRGCTPFELSHFLSQSGAKIMNKTKYFLNGGSTFTYQYKDRKDRWANLDDMKTDQGYVFKNWTRSIVIFFKLVPGITVGPAGVTERITVGVTRKYLYTFEGLNEDRDRSG